MPDSRSDAPIVVVANPHSGNGRAPAILTEAVDTLAFFGHVVTVCEDTLQQMQQALARHAPDASAVVAIGGDGLIHRVTQHLAGTATPLGIIPAGSGNDIARALCLRRDPSRALKEICNALTWPEFTQEIDLLQVSGADFNAWVVGVLSLGLDAKVNYRAVTKTARWGRWRYVTALIGELSDLRADTYTISLDGRAPREMTGIIAAIANLSYFGFGMKIAPMAQAKDGIGEFITVSDVTRGTLMTVFPRIYRGTHISHPAVAHTRAKRFEIACSTDVIVHGDGEALGSMPVTVTVEPAALRVLAAKAEWTSFDS